VCDYAAVAFGHISCYGEISLGADLVQPFDTTGLSLGDVVSVVGSGTAEGWWCYVEACDTVPPPLFDLHVRATYQFTLTDPGSPTPFSWTAAQYSFGPAAVPEPGTWVYAALGLVGLAAAVRGRRRPEAVDEVTSA
jgi:MYXO-CTERM domain-containing protein